MSKAKHKVWVMPKWMEQYRDMFQNTGGNTIEELMNDHETNGFNNVILSALIISVSSQISLLRKMGKEGKLVGVDPSVVE